MLIDLRAGCALLTRKFSGTYEYICYRLSKLQGHSAAGMIREIEKNAMTSSVFERETFRLLAKGVNQVFQF
jgi:predicted transcriptional regulator